MRYWLIPLLLLTVTNSLQAEALNAGFVQGLWYSQETVFAEVPTRVYVAIRNNTGADLTGTVTFFVDDKRLGSQAVSALNNRLIESWIDWMPRYGEHTLRAELTRLRLSVVGSSTETVSAALAAATDSVFVDYDTDADGIGDETDSDDDGDRISDTEESSSGTDPLVADHVASESQVKRERDATNSSGETAVLSTDTTSGSYEGIERYLTPSRADTLLTGVTHWAEVAKQQLDAYRAARAIDHATTSVPAIAVNNDGFGEITRSTEATAASVDVPRAEGAFMGDVVMLIGTLLRGIFTALLFVLSWFLGHPSLVQFSLLLGILVGIYLLARKLGRRPTTKK